VRSPAALEEEVARAALRDALLAPGDAVLVAVSGGADSTALAGLLAGAKGHGLPLRLSLGHVDHGWRGPDEAARDRACVEETARRLGLPLRTEGPPADVRRTEDAARRFRYAALAKMARETGSTLVATGHHLRDQAETLLLRLDRGSGETGLAGIPARRPLEGGTLAVVRPLLGAAPDELRAYAVARGLPFRDDPTNEVLDRDRARVRARLRALGEREAAATRDLAALAARLRRRLESRFRAFSERLRPSVAVHADARAVEADAAALVGVPADAWDLPLRVMGASLDADRDGPWFTRRHLAKAAALFDGPEGGTVQLPHGLDLHRLGSRAILARRDALPLEDLVLEGSPARAAGGLVVASRDDVPASDFDVHAWARSLPRPGGPPPWRAALDAGALGPRLVLRGVRPGDRFTPLGGSREARVSEWLSKAGWPEVLRRGVRVLESPAGIAWVVGHRIDARFAVRSTSARVAVVTVAEEG
jgi:tRNA(Ile)-lysidine synthase